MMKKLFLCVLLVSLNLALSFAVYSQEFTEKFDANALSTPSPWRIEGWMRDPAKILSTEQKLSGSKSFKAYLPTQQYSNARTEIKMEGVNGIPKFQTFRTTWGTAISIYFPKDFKPDFTSQEIILQYHRKPDPEDTAGNPHFTFTLDGDKIVTSVRYSTGTPTTRENQVTKKYTIVTVTPGQWHHFVMDINWDYRLNGNGFAKVYMKKGSKPTKNDIVLNYRGPISSEDQVGPYLKFGIYKWDWKVASNVTKSRNAGIESRLLYFDDVMIKKGGIFEGQSNQPPNEAPAVSITGPRNITLPTNTATFTANATDSDGSISSYSWKKISGPNTSLSGATSKSLKASNLVEGTYTFEVRVTDNDGASSTARITLTVLPQSNQSPGARAGDDQSITLPNNKIRVTGSATDSDGTVQSVRWSKVNGGQANIVNPNSNATDITNLQQGDYTFRFTVTDNDGATTSDNVNIKVLPQPANEDPVANAGNDITITLPINSTTLKGGATDPDGTIDRVKWTKIEGGFADIVNDQRFFTEVRGLQAGRYRFRFEVWDDRGGYDSDVVVVNVLPETSNSRPIVNAGPDQQIQLPVNNVRLTGTASDNDGTIISRTWTKVNGGNANIQSPSALTTDITGLVEGVYTFRLTVRDDAGDTSSDEVIVTVLPEPANAKPLANAGKDQSITLPQNTVTLKGQASDPDGTIDRVKWSKVNGGNAAIANPARYYTDVTGLVAGTYTFKFEVWDNRGAYDSDLVIITVAPEPVNERPIVNAGADQQIQLPVNSIRLTGTASDRDGEITEVTWTKTNGPAATIQNRSSLSTNVTGLVEGVYTFRLTVRDDSGETSSDNVRIRVSPADNVLPLANAGRDITITLPTNSVTLNGTASDQDGTIARVQWTKMSGGAANIQNATSNSTEITGLLEGSYTFRFEVWDDRGGRDADQVKVTVLPQPLNSAPIVNAGQDKQLTLPENSVLLKGSASDNDGRIVEVTWQKINGPAATIISRNSLETNVEDLVAGQYVFRLTARDNNGSTASDDVKVTVSVEQNSAPIVDAGQDIIVEFPVNSVDLIGTASDDGNIQEILWTQLSGDNATIQSPEELTTTITDLNPGEYSFQLSATDNRGATSTDQVLVTVVPENLPPVVNLGSDREVSLPIDTYELIAEAYDPDGEIVSYQWIQEEGPELQIWSATTSAASLEGLEVGNYVLRLIVTDDRGATAEDVIRISASIDVYEQAGIPHVFSPDGNGIDDYWEFGDASVVAGCNMVIFNRQGAKVFESNDYANDWDGTLNGAPLPDGDYYYIIQCDESEEPLTGGVRILRQ